MCFTKYYNIRCQTYCMIEKDIADTVVIVKDIIDLVEMDNLERYIVKTDQEKPLVE